MSRPDQPGPRSPSHTFSERVKLRLSRTIKIGFATDFYWFEVLDQEITVCRLLVLALVVNKPYHIEPVLSAVVSNTEYATDICLPVLGLGIAPG
jgi:hypothetical protein